MSNNENDNLDRDLIDILKFQYQELRGERQRNTTISYAMIGALIPSSIVVILYFPSWWKLFSPLLVLFAYFIDRRLSYYNKLRTYSMERIEREIEKQFQAKKEDARLDFFIMNVVGLYQCEDNLPDNYKEKLNESRLIRIPIIKWIIKDMRVSEYLLITFLFLLIVVWWYLKSCV